MDKSKVIELITRIKAEYFFQLNGMSDEQVALKVEHWYECLQGYSNEQVMDGFKIALMKSDMPPTIPDIVSYIRKAELLKQPSDNELWSMLVEAVNTIKTTLVQETPTSMWRTPIYQLKDKSRCNDVYRKLPIEVRKCVNFETFVLYAGLEEKSMSIERNRFLKAVPEVRQAVSEKKMVGQNNLYLPKKGRLKERNGNLLKASSGIDEIFK